MAEEQQTAQITAAFPAPPPFYQHFSAQNMEHLKELKEAAGLNESESDPLSGVSKGAQSRLLDLPPELRYLVPPPPPADGKYRSFGAMCDVCFSTCLPVSALCNRNTHGLQINEVVRSLKEQNIEQLYPSPPTPDTDQPSSTKEAESGWTLDRAVYLKKMARSILLNFLELVGILSVDPSQYRQKVDDLTTLFINSHHLINEYRPHQARETLIMMMEEQLARKRKEIEDVKALKVKAEALLNGSGKHVNEQATVLDEKVDALEIDADEERKAAQRAAWQALEDELGT